MFSQQIGFIWIALLSISTYRKVFALEKIFGAKFQVSNTVKSWFKKVIFSFLNQDLFDLRKIYVVNLKTGCPQKMPYVGEFPTWDFS